MRLVRLVYMAPSHHVLVEGGERIHGGQEFAADEDRALELLTSPHYLVQKAPRASKPRETPSPEAADTGEPTIQREATSLGEAHLNTPSEEVV